jgi:hypothetical protein
MAAAQTLGARFFPLDPHLTFNRDAAGRLTGMTVREGGRAELSAAKLSLPKQDVTFRNGPVTLAGRITTPSTRGRHPALVIIHGSGAEDRDYLAPWVDYFARNGVAVLAYDKRGVRDSTGDWQQSDFEDLAADVLAGIQLLKGRSDIDPHRIGLFAASQGGWIAPLAAAKSRDVAFIILHAGSALPVGKNGLAYVEAELRGYGFPESEVERALAYYRLNDEVTRTGHGWETLQEAYRQAHASGAEWLLEEPQPPDFWFRKFYRRIMDFDPAGSWLKVSCPVLAFFGELDHNVPRRPTCGPSSRP